MGYKFSLVLSREITANEISLLRDAGCDCAVLAADTLPTNAQIPVTRMDFVDTVSPSLAEAIDSALEAVLKVPELTVPSLTVPAQPAHAESAEPAEATEVTTEATTEAATEAQSNGKKPTARKPTVRKTQDKKAGQEIDVPVDPGELVQVAP